MIEDTVVFPDQRTKWLLSSLLAIVIMLITFITYMPALDNGFVSLDDGGYVVNNVHIRSWSWDNLFWMFTAFEMSNWHPLTWISYTLDYSFFGLNPWGYHLTNVIIHCFNTLWFFLLALFLLTQEKKPSFSTVTYSHLFAATIAAFLLGIHPQHVESVAWVSERKDVLFLFFTLPTVLCYLFYTTTDQIRWYWIALFCFIFACLSKPMVVSIPFVLILIDIYPLKRTPFLTSPSNTVASYRKLIIEKFPFLMLAIALAIVTFFAQQHKGAIVETDITSIDIRLFNAMNSLVLYLSRTFFPIFLSPYYPISKEIYVFPIVTFFLITGVASYLWYRKHPYWIIVWLFYIITLLPVLGIIQVGSQAMADRYAYLPLLPIYLLIGVGFAKIAQLNHRILRMGIIVILVILGTTLFRLTQQQISVWKDSSTLWSQSLKYNSQDNYLAHNEIAKIYMKLGNYPKAVLHCQKSLEINPELKTYSTLANIYFKWDKPEEMLKVYEKMIQAGLEEASGEVDVIFFNIAVIYFRQQNLVKAREAAEKTLKFNPEHAQAKWLLERLNAITQPEY